MGTVTIAGKSYTIYGQRSSGVDSADQWLLGDSKWGPIWDAEEDDDKKNRALVSAYRVLEAESWAEGYASFALRDATADIVHASYELAAVIMGNPGILTQDPGAQGNIKMIDADGAKIEFWRQQDTGGLGGGFWPPNVWRLLAKYLGGAGTVGGVGGYSFGQGEMSESVAASSIFDDDFGITGA